MKDFLLKTAQQVGFSQATLVSCELPDICLKTRTQWLQSQYHGQLSYLQDTNQTRSSILHWHPDAQAAIVCLYKLPHTSVSLHHHLPVEHLQQSLSIFSWYNDYHRYLSQKLHELAQKLGIQHNDYIISVDSQPVAERCYALIAGFGKRGKHGGILSDEHGTHWLIGLIILTSLNKEWQKYKQNPQSDSFTLSAHCENCNTCQQSCPTHAILGNGLINANKCLSYLSVEHRGSIPLKLRELWGLTLFGCDICHQHCPVNRMSLEPNNPDSFFKACTHVLTLSKSQFNKQYRHSSFFRATRDGLARNACLALAHSEPMHAHPILMQALSHESQMVQEHAQWALDFLGKNHPGK